MDRPGKDISQELARESLIAISHSIPDKDWTNNINGVNVVEVKDSDQAEKCRSELISISYTQPPDTKTVPVVALGNLES